MDAGNVFPAEMPDDHPQPMAQPIVPLDDDTAERLLAGHLHPEDAPPGYAEVARLLQAAAGPPSPEELAGLEAALAGFRAARGGLGQGRALRHGRDRPPPRRGRGRPPPRRGRVSAPFRRGGGRPPSRPGAPARLVALALAGTLVAGAMWTGGGVWIADGALTALGLRSPSGGPGSGGPGFGAPGSGDGPGVAGGAGRAGGSGSLRPVTTAVTGGRAPGPPSASERAAAHHGRGATSRGGGSAHGARLGAHGKPPSAKPPKAKPPSVKPPEAGKAEAGKARQGEPKTGGPKRGGAKTPRTKAGGNRTRAG
jgi:hypothetical protein